MDKSKIAILLALVAIILATIAFSFPKVRQFGATATEGLREFTNFDNVKTGALEVTATSSVNTTGEYRLGNKFYRPIGGTCDNLSATLFNEINYNGATSTVRNFHIDGQNGTTTITLEVGTTSITTLLGGSLPATSLISAIGIGTSSAFWIDAGKIAGLGGNATSSGANTFIDVVLGPTDRLYGRATSTADHQAKSGDPTLQGLTNTNNEFTCTWEALLER